MGRSLTRNFIYLANDFWVPEDEGDGWDQLNGNVRFRLKGTPILPEVTLTVMDSDAGYTEGDTVPFMLSRTGDVSNTLSVAVSWDASSGLVSNDLLSQTTVTFAKNARTATVSAATIDDEVFNETERLALSLSPVSAATNATPVYRVGQPNSAEVEVADNDPLPVVTVAATVPEGGYAEGDEVQFTLSRTEDVADELLVKVSWQASGEGVVPDGILRQTSLTFARSQRNLTLLVNTLNNDIHSGGPSILALLLWPVVPVDSNGIPLYKIGSPDYAEVQLADDDPVPVVTLVLTPSTIAEDGGVSTVTATLDRPSNLPTHMDVSVEAGAPVRLSSNRLLTILSGQTESTSLLSPVTLTARDNDVDAPDRRVQVRASARNSNGIVGPEPVTLTITDDDGTPDVPARDQSNVPPEVGLNVPPEVGAPIPTQYARVGEPYTFTVPAASFTDADGDALTYRARWTEHLAPQYGWDLPAWLTFDPATRTFSGTPGAADVDSVSVKVEARDGQATASQIFYLEVQPALREAAPLVSNLDQGWRLGSRHRGGRTGQRFTTGPNPAGYTLTSVEIGRWDRRADRWTDDAHIALSLCPGASTTGCTAFVSPARTTRGADTMRFTAPGDGVALAASTAYDLVLTRTGGEVLLVGVTQIDRLDADALPGWRLHRTRTRTTLRVALHGTAPTPAARPTSADAHVRVAPGGAYALSPADFPFTAASPGTTLAAIVLATVPERKRSNQTTFKRGRLTYDGADIEPPFTVTTAALAAERLVYRAPAAATGEDYDGFRFRVRDADQASRTTYRMAIDILEPGQAQALPGALEPPTVMGAPAISPAGPDGAWGPGEKVAVTVSFSEAVTVDTAAGTPSIGLELDFTAVRRAVYERGSGTDELVFSYTLTDADGSPTSMAVGVDTLALNGGAIRGRDSGLEAELAHAGTAVRAAIGRRAAPPPPRTMTGSFSNVAPEHDGATPIGLDFAFSEAPQEPFSFRTVRNHVFTVEGGQLFRAKRATKGANVQWKLLVRPAGAGDVTLTLRATQSCDAAGAVCAPDGTPLTGTVTTTIPGPAVISAADTAVEEGLGATLDFVVTLSRARHEATTVWYETSDGTAQAEQDYRGRAGTLTFAAYETTQTVAVPVLDDSHDEGVETMILRLLDPSGARLGDDTATGTIKNSDPLQRAWLARFGRTVGTHVTDAITERLWGSPGPGSHLTIGGYRLPLGQGAQGKTHGSTSPGPSLYLRKGVYCMLFYSPIEPNSPTLLRAPKPACKHGAFGSASRQPAQLPGPCEPGSVGKVGRRGRGASEQGASYGLDSDLCRH